MARQDTNGRCAWREESGCLPCDRSSPPRMKGASRDGRRISAPIARAKEYLLRCFGLRMFRPFGRVGPLRRGQDSGRRRTRRKDRAVPRCRSTDSGCRRMEPKGSAVAGKKRSKGTDRRSRCAREASRERRRPHSRLNVAKEEVSGTAITRGERASRSTENGARRTYRRCRPPRHP